MKAAEFLGPDQRGLSEFQTESRDLLVRHRETLVELISHRFSLDQVHEAFAAAADRKSGASKVQIMPGGF